MEVTGFTTVSPEVSAKYREILKDNGITDEVSEVLLKENATNGEGGLSHQHYVQVKFSDPKVKPLNLFVKANTGFKMDVAMKVFEKESRFYNEYVPAIKEFCKSKGQGGLIDFYPKCYYGDMEMIVFENLVVDKGYFALDKNERIGLEGARLAMITLAKHHAISHAFIKHVGGPEPFFMRFPNLDFEPFEHAVVTEMVTPCIENGISTNIMLIEKHDISDKDTAVSLLRAHIGKGYQMCMDTLRYRAEEEKVLTLTHGDYWTSNMMFLRDGKTNKLHSHITFDLQLTRYNSPALDIGNFMHTSVKPEVRRAHLKELLQLYLDVFLETTEKLACPIQLSYEEFFLIYRRKFVYGFWFSIWLVLDVAYKITNHADLKDDSGSFSDIFDKLLRKWIDENPEKSKESAKALVELMKEYSNLVVHEPKNSNKIV